jgi:hypothetical protein
MQNVESANELSPVFTVFATFAKGVSTMDANINVVKQGKLLLRNPPGLLPGIVVWTGRMGLTGDLTSRMIVFLACLTSALSDPVSVLLCGKSAAGKSCLANTILRLFPGDRVIQLTSMSPKALFNTDEDFGGKILYITEFRGSREARFELRQLLSEGVIARESAKGAGMGTRVARKKGKPVLLTTTTEPKIFVDDWGRVMPVWVDESAEQTRRVLHAHLSPKTDVSDAELEAVKSAVQLLLKRRIVIHTPPWFSTVADHVPVKSVLVRRAFPQLISLCGALALIRALRDGITSLDVEISFEDYCVSHVLLNGSLSRKFSPTPGSSEGDVVDCVTSLYQRHHRAVSAKEVMIQLDWKSVHTYKCLNSAKAAGYLTIEGGKRANNQKLWRPDDSEGADFMIAPQQLLKAHPELSPCTYIDPITGEEVEIKHEDESEIRLPRPKRKAVKVA